MVAKGAEAERPEAIAREARNAHVVQGMAAGPCVQITHSGSGGRHGMERPCRGGSGPGEERASWVGRAGGYRLQSCACAAICGVAILLCSLRCSLR